MTVEPGGSIRDLVGNAPMVASVEGGTAFNALGAMAKSGYNPVDASPTAPGLSRSFGLSATGLAETSAGMKLADRAPDVSIAQPAVQAVAPAVQLGRPS